MSGFSEEWLSLRESADTTARNPELMARLQAWLQPCATLAITDLGAGTGSNLRYLAPRLGGEQHWTLVDNDSALLEALPALLARWGESHQVSVQERSDGKLQLRGQNFTAEVTRLQRDLARPLASDLFAGRTLVTASALLDLASRDWLSGLADRLAERLAERLANRPSSGVACLFVLSVNGHIQWQPVLPGDDEIRHRFNQHQQSDKGLGMAAGPHAGHAMADALAQAGFDVYSGDSDWQLGSDAVAMQAALAEGFVEAALELSGEAEHPHEFSPRSWLEQRQALWEKRQSSLIVGHVDVLALPKESSARDRT